MSVDAKWSIASLLRPNRSPAQAQQTEVVVSPWLARGLWALLGVGLSIVFAVLLTGYWHVEEFKALGPWGDFAGGLLNPVLTFLTFIAVLLTLWLQRDELALTREEMIRSANALEEQGSTLRRQSFENTFFEMLRLHNSIVESIDLINSDSGVVTKGRDAFRVFYTRLTKIYRENVKKAAGRHDDRHIVELSYFNFWKDAQTELSHYFRFLFNFFRFIDKSGFEEEYYVKLLRSQISDAELLILFYNNISEAGSPFRYYADKYAIFDNMPVVRLLERGHAQLADKAAFGDNPMNFRPGVPRGKTVATTAQPT